MGVSANQSPSQQHGVVWLCHEGTYQDQGCVVKLVTGIDVHAFGDLLLAYFQIASPRCFAESTEVSAEIERVLVLEATGGDGFVLVCKRFFKLMFSQDGIRHDRSKELVSSARGSGAPTMRQIRRETGRNRHDLRSLEPETVPSSPSTTPSSSAAARTQNVHVRHGLDGLRQLRQLVHGHGHEHGLHQHAQHAPLLHRLDALEHRRVRRHLHLPHRPRSDQPAAAGLPCRARGQVARPRRAAPLHHGRGRDAGGPRAAGAGREGRGSRADDARAGRDSQGGAHRARETPGDAVALQHRSAARVYLHCASWRGISTNVGGHDTQRRVLSFRPCGSVRGRDRRWSLCGDGRRAPLIWLGYFHDDDFLLCSCSRRPGLGWYRITIERISTTFITLLPSEASSRAIATFVTPLYQPVVSLSTPSSRDLYVSSPRSPSHVTPQQLVYGFTRKYTER
nr:hypothetical protein CFP56_07611 [Quercus suber]